MAQHNEGDSRNDQHSESSDGTDAINVLTGDIRRVERELTELSSRLDSIAARMDELRAVDRDHRDDQMRFLERQIVSNAEQISELAGLVRTSSDRAERNERQIEQLAELSRENSVTIRDSAGRSERNERQIEQLAELTRENSIAIREGAGRSERNERQIEQLAEMARTLTGRLERLDTSIKIGTAVIAFVITTGVAIIAIFFG